jgi:hypothetical protein
MMTTGDETGRCFWGPNGIWTKFLASTRTAVTELRALVARQAAAILRLLSHLANLGGGGAAPMAIAADLPGDAPPALNPPSLPAAPAKPPPAPAAQAPDGSGGELTLDQLRPLLRAALKIPKPRYQKPTIDGGLNRSTLFRRRQNCAPMTDLWMENCGFATNETVPARIVAASLDPKILKAAGRLVAGRRVRSATSLRREHLRIMRGLIAEKKLDPLFSQRQAVERAMSGISSRNMAAMRKMNRNALGEDLDKFHSGSVELQS